MKSEWAYVCGVSIAENLPLPTVPFRPGQSRQERQALLRSIAADNWLARTEIGYSVLTYDAVVGVLRDKRWHSATGLAAQIQGITDEEFNRERVNILSAEGDVHVRLRRLVAPAFSPRSSDRLRPFMREVVSQLAEPIATTGSGDAVAAICEPYPIPIICELLGAPKEDWQLFSRLATDVLRIFSDDLKSQVPIIVAARKELNAYTRDLIAKRRALPKDDLLTDLISAEEEGDKLTAEELEMMVEAVIVGGTDTTRNQLGLAIALFAEHPDQWEMLRNDPSLAPRAVEEVMRYHGAVGGTVRFASEDIEMNGVLFPKGTLMSTSMSSANFDSSVFPEPETFDITREPVGQPHMSFGSGIHYCLGASLARAELQEAFVVLSQRMPKLALTDTPIFKPTGVGIFGPAYLPISCEPGH